jgi:hypothetical protein
MACVRAGIVAARLEGGCFARSNPALSEFLHRLEIREVTVAGKSGLVTIGVDPHKRLNAVEVVDGRGAVLAQRVFKHSTAGFKELTGFARSWRTRQ